MSADSGINRDVPDANNPPVNQQQRRGRWRRPSTPIAAAALGALVLACFVVSTVGGLDWFIAVSTLGTAIGTLGLAFYTYRLASSTQDTVAESQVLASLSRKQLVETQKQVELSARQVEASAAQAAFAGQSAQAAQASAREASRARIDAIAPLLHLTVSADHVEELGRDRQVVKQLTPDHMWYEAQLKDAWFRVRLHLQLQNVGKSPAQVSFPSYQYDLERLSAGAGIRRIDLQPGQKYEDSMLIHFAGQSAAHGKPIEISITYEGILHGEMFDHLQWRGEVSAVQLQGGEARLAMWVLNAGPASVVRSYPNLERPDEMKEVRARLLSLRDNAADLSPALPTR